MILQALYQLAHTEELMADPDYEYKPVAWLVRVSKEGKLLGIEGTHYIPPGEAEKKKPRLVAKPCRIPKQPIGRAGIKAPASFFVDNAKYVFGLPTKDKNFLPKEGREKSGWFRDMITECAQETGDEGALAVSSFLSDVAAGKQKVSLPEECISNELFAFMYSPDIDLLVHKRPRIQEYWMRMRSDSSGQSSDNVRCLVSGQPVGENGLFPQIERVPGGSPSRIGLVSFNAPAFESYGWKRNENAPVARESSEACATALNRLLHPAYPDPVQPGQSLPKQNLRLSADTVVCFWASDKSANEFCSGLGGLLDANPDEVGELYRSIWRGQPPVISDPSVFYALTLTGTQGRAIVRDWLESSVSKVANKLAAHFGDLEIVRNTPPPKKGGYPPQFPLRLLLESLAPEGDGKKIPARMVGQMVRAAMSGTLYPLSILQRALERTRAEIGKDQLTDRNRRDARAALIKAVLNRRQRFSATPIPYMEVLPEMDPTNDSPGYRLGRLLAVIERMQQTALGNINASVVDRFFGGASATPAAVFPRLLKNLRHHARKAKGESQTARTAGWLERQVDEIMAPLDAFPPHLDLEQQGLFVLGFHHQRHWLFMSKEDREALAHAQG